MHIQQITIKNFRCFENLTVKLNPDVNIFVGNNGSGKSAVLDAIAAAIYPYIEQLQNFEDKEYAARNLPLISQQDLPVKNLENLMKFVVSVKDFPDREIVYGKAHDDENATLKVEHLQNYLMDLNNFLEDPNFDGYPSILNSVIIVVAYYKGNRNLTNINDLEIIPSHSFNRFDALKNAFDATVNFTDFASWLFNRQFQELREGKKRGDTNFEFLDLKHIRKAISTIIAPNVCVDFTQATSAKLMVEWETETGEKLELSLSQLSSGYRNMLALVMDFARRLAQANPQMENPLEAEAVLMIDELDLHLHPTWQQKIIPDLRKVFPNTQIIATTHSPEIITTVERHQVKILEDYQIKECPSPTRGMKSSDIVRYVLGLDNLRPDTEESRNLTALFNAIDNRNLEEAKLFRDKLQDWKSFDPDITRADMQIRRLEREMTV
jgi:predicted ATP-binding protein involved in virulence